MSEDVAHSGEHISPPLVFWTILSAKTIFGQDHFLPTHTPPVFWTILIWRLLNAQIPNRRQRARSWWNSASFRYTKHCSPGVNLRCFSNWSSSEMLCVYAKAMSPFSFRGSSTLLKSCGVSGPNLCSKGKTSQQVCSVKPW